MSRDDQGEKRRGDQRELDRGGALAVGDERAPAAAPFPGTACVSVMALSYWVRLAVLDATLMNSFVSASVMSPPV